ncbi:MAG: hypothetical protein QXS00_08005 [Pyrobaculum sp.]
MEKVVGHILKVRNELYIYVPKGTRLYDVIMEAVKNNGDSARGLRVEIEVASAAVRRVKLE